MCPRMRDKVWMAAAPIPVPARIDKPTAVYCFIVLFYEAMYGNARRTKVRGKGDYFVGADGWLMPVCMGRTPADLRHQIAILIPGAAGLGSAPRPA